MRESASAAKPVGLCLTLWLVAMLAALSMLVAPLEIIQPAKLHFVWWQFRLVALINPVVFIALASAVGCWAAPRVGLDAPLLRALLERRSPGPVLRAQAGPALFVGFATAAILFGYDRLSAPWFAAAPVPDLPLPLVTKLLYGGVVEEVITRWGLMSLFVWLAWKLMRSARPAAGAYWAGALLAALLFAAGHLPLLFAVMPHPPAGLVAAVIVGNTLPGLMFGWLYWRRGLEAAMLAHALGHLVFTLVAPG